MFIHKVIIVDDKPNFARIFEKTVKNFESRFEDNFYEPFIISGIDTYDEAKRFIQLNQSEIDILLIDYNIETHLKGTDLFKVIDKSRYLIYKILHSITAVSQYLTKEEFKNLYDDFCYSKDPIEITKMFEKFETHVLDIKLWGNKKFRANYNISRTKLDNTFDIPVFSGVKLFDIIYAKSIGKDEITICFRNYNTRKIDFLTRTGYRLTHFTSSEYYFKHISNRFVINLLWVAKINTNENKIRFIALDNILFEEDYIPTAGSFDVEIKPFLSDIDKNIPFFLKA